MSDADDSLPGTEQILGDSAYGTRDMVAKLEVSGHTNAVKPWPIRHNMPDGFTTDDFAVDHDARTVTCPAGHTVGFTAAKRAPKFGETVHRLSAGGVVHQRIPRPHRQTRNPRRVAKGPPRTVGHRAAVACRLPPAPPEGGTVHRLDDPRSPPTALPRHHQERRMVATASSRHQPAQTHPIRPGYHHHRMGPDLTAGNTRNHPATSL